MFNGIGTLNGVISLASTLSSPSEHMVWYLVGSLAPQVLVAFSCSLLPVNPQHGCPATWNHQPTVMAARGGRILPSLSSVITFANL